MFWRLVRGIVLASACCAALVSSPSAHASSGALDTTFGTSGVTLTPEVGGSAYAMVVQQDGKIVLGGDGSGGFTIARYTSNGALDTSFGGGDGITALNYQYQDAVTALALQQDGSIVAGGSVAPDGYCCAAALMRFSSSGVLDTTFGTNGIATFPGLGLGGAKKIFVLPDGHILVYATYYGGNQSGVALLRYTSTGTLDATFGTDGEVTVPDLNGGAAIQSDGKIVVAGSNGANSSDVQVTRLDTDGAFDSSFSGDGKATFDLGGNDSAAAVAVVPGGKLVVVATGGQYGHVAVLRLQPNGTLDTCFGTNGIGWARTEGIDTENAGSVAIDPTTGKIMTLGDHIIANPNPGQLYVRALALDRFHADGTADVSFGDNGRVTTVVPLEARGAAIAVQPGGRIVVGGGQEGCDPSCTFDRFLLAGYTNDGRIVTTTNNSGAGSLRQALLDANSNAGSETIDFVIPGGGPQTISPASSLPVATDPVAVDGESENSCAGAPGIRLDNGTGMDDATGLVLGGGSQAIGLSVTGFGTGIELGAPGGSTISQSWLGIAPDGTLDPNGTGASAPAGSGGDTFDRSVVGGNDTGIDIRGSDVEITRSSVGVDASGGLAANGIGLRLLGARAAIGGAVDSGSVVSGNDTGIVIYGADAHDNVVAGNLVGTDPEGTTALANGVGVEIASGAHGNTIGGDTAGARNVISGNTGQGILVTGDATDGNAIGGNRIGTNGAGTAAVGNGVGIEIANGASSTAIGTGGAGNLVSGNTGAGIDVKDAGTDATTVDANRVGTNAVGTAALGNGGGGIVIENGATATVVGASSSSRNLISGNAVAGVLVTGVGTDGNSIIANLIGTNAAETASIPNPLGVRIEQGAAANQVGLNSSGDGNVISGNSGLGVSIATGANGNFVQGNQLEGNGGGVGISASSGNLVGGTGPSPVGNTIVSNSGPGVAVDATAGAANGNSILLNTIAANSAASIVLTAGANHAQAAPAIKPPKNARPGKKSTISGSLLSSPATVFRIEIYETGTCDQAASFLGGGLLTTNKNGKAAFKLTTFGGLQKGTAIESTATNMATGDTSALSACVLVK